MQNCLSYPALPSSPTRIEKAHECLSMDVLPQFVSVFPADIQEAMNGTFAAHEADVFLENGESTRARICDLWLC